MSKKHIVEESRDGQHLDAVIRELHEVSWGKARRWIERGKVFVDGEVSLNGRLVVRKQSSIEVRSDAPLPRGPGHITNESVLHLDREVIVVLKPPGVSTLPFAGAQELETGTLLDGVKRYLANRTRSPRSSTRKKRHHGALPPISVVQRLDRGTSGVLVFARTKGAAVRLGEQFREHAVHRRYTAIVHGFVASQTLRSHLLEDRGDGVRGSLEQAIRPELKRGPHAKKAKLAVTHVTADEQLRAGPATIISCQLETGRTNQIRIHLGEAGHPLVGETLYTRGFRGQLIDAPRLMLHAHELAFDHPATGKRMRFEVPLPPDMARTIERLS